MIRSDRSRSLLVKTDQVEWVINVYKLMFMNKMMRMLLSRLSTYWTSMNAWILKRSAWQLVACGYLIRVGLGFLFGYLLFPEQQSASAILNLSVMDAFWAAAIFGPLMETYLIQHLVIKYVYKWTGIYWIAVLTSALIFGAMHTYSVPYMISAFLSGIIYGTIYAVLAIRDKYPILYTALTHSLYNLTGFCIEHVF